MGRLVKWLFAVLLVGALAWFFVPRYTGEEVVRSLDASFAIQEDGTVDVRYELDWQFARDGQRGINFGIVTREPWGADLTQDAVYDVSDVRVSSPTGAPSQVLESETSAGPTTSLNLRIGDPDATVDGRDQTYVIEYTISGALRTFEDGPQFFWDVTGDDYPPIEEFTVNVSAPGAWAGRVA